MSNATSPSAKSPQPADTFKDDSAEKASAEQDVFPFLVHSQDSVTNGDPPDVDNAKLARQKRKRTSPEDQATLEAEYKKNPKPDKAARVAIVEQVSLGEKEVQIWFQNRRQNTRRKSRPLLPHEIAAFGLSGMSATSSDHMKASSFHSSFASSQGDTLPSNSQPESNQNEDDDRTPSSPELKEPTTISLKTPAPDRISNMETSFPTFTPLKPSTTFQDSYTPFAPGFSHSQPTPGYLANRWNMSSICGTPNTSKAAAKFMTPSTNQKGGFMTPGQGEAEPQLPSSGPLPIDFSGSNSNPTPPSNNVRLSLSLDGHASLVSADMSSSPPRPTLPRPASALSARRSVGLQRSYSAAAAVPFSLSRTTTPIAARTSTPHSSSSGVPRLPSGRSRDATTWQLCADAESRDELTMHADNESNGSAVAAISLIRSTSGKALKPNSNKRNAATEKVKMGSGKRVKATLARGVSALGRLQGGGNGSVARKAPERMVENPKEKGREVMGMASPTDSDKENWLPDGTPGSVRRPLPGFKPKSSPVKAPNSRSKPTGNTPNTGRNRNRAAGGKKAETKIYEDVDSEDDENENKRREKETSEEVERFMRGASPSKKGDLDCIQGLLSLSQGNWR